MPDTPSGYGPPRVDAIRVERGPQAPAGVAPPDAASAASGEAVRLVIQGEGFILRAMPLLVQVGDQVLSRITLSQDGRTITCQLDQIPEEGAVIRVGYPPDDMTELPERFSLSMLEPGDSE